MNSHLHELDNLSVLTLNPLKVVLRRENVNPNDCVQCCVIGYHGNSLLHFGFNTKVSCEGLLGEGG